MVKLCLMASYWYPSGTGIVFHPEQNRVVKVMFELDVYILYCFWLILLGLVYLG